jgi:hypothetical protein
MILAIGYDSEPGGEVASLVEPEPIAATIALTNTGPTRCPYQSSAVLV